MQTIPVLYLQRRFAKKTAKSNLVYGVLKLENQEQLKFLSLPCQPSVLIQLFIQELQDVVIQQLVISKIQLLRKASAGLYTDEFVDQDNYSMTNSIEDVEYQSNIQMRRFEKSILLQFGLDILKNLDQLSGRKDTNSVRLFTEAGMEYVFITTSKYLQMLLQQFENLRINIRQQLSSNSKEVVKKKSHNQVLEYEMSDTVVVFPITTLSPLDKMVLQKSAATHSPLGSFQQVFIDSAIDKLVIGIYNLKSSRANIQQYFSRNVTSILIGDSFYNLVDSYPEQLKYQYQQIIVVFSIQNDGRWLATLFEKISIEKIFKTGVISILNTSYQASQITFQQYTNRYCQFIIQTAHQILIFLFSSFISQCSSGHIRDTYFWIVESDTIQGPTQFPNIFFSARKDDLCLQLNNIVILRLELDLKRLISSYYIDGKQIFMGDEGTGFYQAPILNFETWRFIIQ